MKKFKIVENNDDQQGSFRSELDLILTPLDGSSDDVINALEDVDNYGVYVSNMRNKREIELALIKHFGPTLPTKKRPLEKAQGFPFPVKSKQAIDDFIRSFNSKPNLLTYEVDGNNLIFPTDKNTSKQNTKNIIKQVMDSAGIRYKLKDFEDLRENIQKNRMMKLAGINEIKIREPYQHQKITDWFEVFDFFGGDLPPSYADAERGLNAAGKTVSDQIYNQALNNSQDNN